MGSVEPLKKLHERWGDHIHFVDIVIRQAHPGPGAPTYQRMDQKISDAERYQREDGIPWPVVVDDLHGTVHQVYSGLSDPTYLIDAEGRVAFVNMVTHALTLHQGIEQLFARGGIGVVGSGWDRVPRVGPALTDGWRGLRRGLPQSLIDIETSVPGAGTGSWLGYQLRPVLAPVTLRSKPLPWAANVLLGLSGAIMLTLAVRWITQRYQGRT